MAISLVSASATPSYVSTGTTVSVTLPAGIVADDLIILAVYGRSAITTPSGYTAAATNTLPRSNNQREAIFYKTAAGTESSTSVTITQASSGRAGVAYALYRSNVGACSLVDTDIQTEVTTATAAAGTVTAASAYLAFSAVGNVFADTSLNFNEPSIAVGSDAAWIHLTTTGAGLNANRLSMAGALLSSGSSPALTWETDSVATNSWGVLLAAFTDSTDSTAPVLTSPTGTQTGSTTATGTVSTDEGNGTLDAVVTTSATTPSAAQIQAGQDHTGAAAAATDLNNTVTTTGVQNVSFTGLTAATTYYVHYVHEDAATNVSTAVSSASFTTAAAAVKGVQLSLKQADGTTAAASLTGLYYHAWDALNPGGASAANGAAESTDVSGVLEININSFTASIGGEVFLFVYDLDGTEDKDSVCFAGRVPVVDIS